MTATKLNLAASLFIFAFSLFLLDAGAREWQIIIFFAPGSAALGAWLAFQKLLRQEVAWGVFGLIQCLYWPLAFVAITTFPQGVARQTALSLVVVAYFAACAVCLWQAFRHFARPASQMSSPSA